MQASGQAWTAVVMCLLAGLALRGVTVADATTESHLATATTLFERGDYSQAVSVLDRALAAHPDARLYHWLARSLYELEEYEAAIDAAERAVELDPNNSEYHRWLGKCYGRRAEQKSSFTLARKVKKSFVAAVDADGSNLRARRDLMQFLVKAPFIVGGSKKGAREQAETIAERDPVEGRLAWAYYKRRTGDPGGAVGEYERVLTLRPAELDPYFEIADFGVESEDIALIERAVAAASAVAQGDHRFEYYRGVAGVLGGESLAEAREELESYLAEAPRSSERPSHAQAHEWLGDLHRKLGEGGLAAGHYRAALELDPDAEGVEEKLRDLN